MSMLADIADAAGGQRLSAEPGQTVFRPNDPCKGFIAMRSGIVRVQLASPNGREIVLYRVGPGQVCLQTFRCLVDRASYAAEGVAERHVEAFLIAPATFDSLLRDDVEFRAAVMGSIAMRFSDYEHVVETLAFAGLGARLAGALVSLAGEDRMVHATHESLASEIGSAREAVSRQLALFARDGLVQLSRGRIALQNRDALLRMSALPA